MAVAETAIDNIEVAAGIREAIPETVEELLGEGESDEGEESETQTTPVLLLEGVTSDSKDRTHPTSRVVDREALQGLLTKFKARPANMIGVVVGKDEDKTPDGEPSPSEES